MRLLPTLLLTGCASVEVAVGPQIGESPWEGRGPIVEAAVRHDLNDRAFCEYRHTSNLRSGWPFNNDPETHLDRVTCGVRLSRQAD